MNEPLKQKKNVQKEINKIVDITYHFNIQVHTYEQLLESLMLIESELCDILESITSDKLKILHPSIIKAEILWNQLNLISQHLQLWMRIFTSIKRF